MATLESTGLRAAIENDTHMANDKSIAWANIDGIRACPICYEFTDVDWSLLVAHLRKQQVTITSISDVLLTAKSTIDSWSSGKAKPRTRDLADRLVTLSINYLARDKLEQCGIKHHE